MLIRPRRGTAKSLVSGFSHAKQEGFSTLADAEAYLENQPYTYLGGDTSSELAPEKSTGKPRWIAVAEGRHTGIYPCYTYCVSNPEAQKDMY